MLDVFATHVPLSVNVTTVGVGGGGGGGGGGEGPTAELLRPPKALTLPAPKEIKFGILAPLEPG